MKKVYLLIIFTFMMFIPINVNALKPSEIDQYQYYDYVIDSYDIEIVVNEDNTYEITENIEAYFLKSKHGIYRYIPSRNEITRLDGTIYKNTAKLSDLKVNEEYDLSRENGNYSIKIGSANRTLTGSKLYEIKYKYNLGKDPLKEKDEMYFNVIGNKWDTVIGNITFKIIMPKEFDEEKLGFSSGIYGSLENDKINYYVDDNVIIGSYDGILDSNSAITMRLELPENYFTGESDNMSIYLYLVFIIPILSAFISFILWYKFGNDEKTIDVVEYYPPNDFNSLEVGYLYKGNANEKDVISLLIYLANKGYIKIHQGEDKIFSSKDNFKIEKIKDYDGNNENEKMFFDGLFNSTSNIVSFSSLKNKFYTVVRRILSNVNTKHNKNKIIDKKSTNMKKVATALAIISLCSIIGIPVLDYNGYESFMNTLMLVLFFTPFLCVMFMKNTGVLFKIIWIAAVLPNLTVFVIFSDMIDVFKYDMLYLTALIIGMICIVLMIILSKITEKRTDYGLEMLSKIKGFKMFLENVEKDKINELVMENPEYFYEVLPYTYVLDISDKWIEQFESIITKEPNWYVGNGSFNVSSFNSFVNTTISSTTSSVRVRTTSSSSGSSGGRSSGGGSSGGGSGGGGGSSW